jgi:hypothetical protein
MRTVALFVGIGGLAFAAAGFQAGLFQSKSPSNVDPVVSDATPEVKPELKKETAKTAVFPRDLAPAARAEAVTRAAAFDPNAKMHRMVILKTNGRLYQEWQDKLREEWQANSVEQTSLVIVVGQHKKQEVDVIYYPDNSPPIHRYKFEVEASIVEAKTGKVLANRLFINIPRKVERIETWNTTAFGSPVEFRTVFQWAVAQSLAGFPLDPNPTPIVNVSNN